jgi:UDP-3-O-[3-hydroxymyristoyl] glucosamine N-acyltransferase
VSWSVAKIADFISGEVVGNADHVVNSVATLENAASHQLSFLSNTKYKKFLSMTQAGVVLVDKKPEEKVATNLIVVSDAYVAYAKVATLLNPPRKQQSGIHPTAWIEPSAKLADDVSVGPHAFIGANVKLASGVEIGAGCVVEENVSIAAHSCLRANVTLCYDVVIGERVLIHSGVVIGADGFGIANDKGRWIKVPQLGSVEIGNDVEIGANTTIDRGAIDSTIISDGVKLDNQIQIAHNVFIDEHTVIAGCVGIAGSTQIGKHCAIGGGTGIAGHITICDAVQFTGMSMVTKSIKEPGVYSSGIPVEPSREWHKNVIRYRNLDKFNERLITLEEKQK